MRTASAIVASFASIFAWFSAIAICCARSSCDHGDELLLLRGYRVGGTSDRQEDEAKKNKAENSFHRGATVRIT